MHGAGHTGAGTEPVQVARIAGASSCGFPRVAIHSTRGSRRNHMRWRRGEPPGAAHGLGERGVEVRRFARRGTRAPRGSRSPGPRCARAGAARAASARTSSSRPPARIAREAGFDATVQRARGRSRCRRCGRRSRGAAVGVEAGPERRERPPVDSNTSSARTMRRRLFGSMRAAATGSTAAQPVVRTCDGRRSFRSRPGARRARRGLRRGSRGRRRRRARTGRCRRRAARAGPSPRCRRSRHAPAAACRATDQSSDGSATSTRWCGTTARSETVGFAVPMSIPRYTCIESSETISTSPARRRDLQRERGLARGGRADEREMSRHAGDADTGMRTRRDARRPDAPRRARPAASAAPRR